MEYKPILFAVLLMVIVVLVGCARSSTGYAAYDQQQANQQPYVGGGCGVAPVDSAGEGSDGISSVSTSNL